MVHGVSDTSYHGVSDTSSYHGFTPKKSYHGFLFLIGPMDSAVQIVATVPTVCFPPERAWDFLRLEEMAITVCSRRSTTPFGCAEYGAMTCLWTLLFVQYSPNATRLCGLHLNYHLELDDRAHRLASSCLTGVRATYSDSPRQQGGGSNAFHHVSLERQVAVNEVLTSRGNGVAIVATLGWLRACHGVVEPSRIVRLRQHRVLYPCR